MSNDVNIHAKDTEPNGTVRLYATTLNTAAAITANLKETLSIQEPFMHAFKKRMQVQACTRCRKL